MLKFETLTVSALLLAALLMAGCTPSGNATKQGGTKHDHPDAGPHGGPLAEWGEEEYHAEFTVDRGKKQATVYILDESAKKAKPIAAESITLTLKNVTPAVTVTLKAEPLEGEPKGTSSRFSGTHDKLGDAGPFYGEIAGKVGDTPYKDRFEEKK